MKFSAFSRWMGFVALIALVVIGLIVGGSQPTPSSVSVPPAQPAASAKSSTRSGGVLTGETATVTDALAAPATAAPLSAAAMASARPLWSAPVETRGTKLQMNAAVSSTEGAGGAREGRSARFDAASVPALGALRAGEMVTLPLFDGQVATGRVNLVQADAQEVVRVGGELTGERHGSFSLGENARGIEGTILLPGEGLALLIAQQLDGRYTLVEKPIGEVLCTPMPKAPEVARADAGAAGDAQVSAITIPILSSRPSATAVIYLDFDGETVTDPRWNGGQTIVAAPANVTAADVQQAWASIKEDYWAFNIDVTTDVNRYNNAPVNRRTRCIVTPTDTAAPGSGGVAYVNCFSRGGTSTFSATIPCWVFVSGAKPIAEAAAHEVGHTLGLRHDGRTGEEYYAGHGSGAVGWAPIMGVGYYRELVQWSRGEYPNASNTEDDLAIISSATNGFGYVADEAGNTRGTAAVLGISGNAINQVGIISNSGDVDYYSVSIGVPGTIAVTASPASVSPDLDVLLSLEDVNGTTLATNNPDLTLGASLSVSVGAGTYYMRVQGTGRSSVSTDGYSNYGSIGAYTLTGTIAGAAQAPTLGPIANQNFTAGVLAGPIGFSVADADTDVNLLTLSVTSSNQAVVANAGISLGGSGGARSLSLLTLAPGSTTITVGVSDGALSSSTSFVVNVTAPTILPSFTLNPASQSVNVGASVTLSAAATGTPAPSYQWLKNGSPIAGATGTSFSITNVGLIDAGSYAVTATNSAGSVTSATATLTVNSVLPNSPLLSGTTISTAPWGNYSIYQGSNAFDGNANTFFAGRPEDSFVYVGRDFGSAKTVDRLRYLPRAGFAWRMTGGMFRGANNSDLSDAVTLYTIASTPPEGVWQDIVLPATGATYRYVFYTTTSINEADIAEIECYGTGGAVPTSPLLGGTTISTAPWGNYGIYQGSNAFDGNANTFFAGRPEDSFVYVGRDFGSAKKVDRIRYLPRSGFAWRMTGGMFRGANNSDLSDAVTLYTIASTPPEGVWQDIVLPATGATYRYVFYTTTSINEADIAEIELYGTGGAVPVSPLLGGTTISTAPWGNYGIYQGSNAFDGNANTFFAGRPEDSFVYVGRDFGSAKKVDRIRYLPRSGFAWRMTGGMFRGANNSDLSDAVTLLTITAAPPEGVWQDVSLPPSAASYRYVFFTTAPINEADIAELEFYGPGT